jgi:sugar phosphate isomerase/epimerase
MSRLGFHCNRLRQLEPGIVENGLQRGEFYNFPKEELPALKQQIQHHNLELSIHAPSLRPEWYPDPPTWSFLCDVDKENRNLTMKMIVEAVELAQDFGAEYIVVHFPTPASDAAGESLSKLEGIAHRSCDWLAELSERRGMPIHVEGVGASPFLTVEFLSQVLSEYPVLHYCFDTGHMQLASQSTGFDLYAFAEGIAHFVGSVHLWNTRGAEDYQAFHHIPIHPSQNPGEGWVDIARVLKTLEGQACPIIMESPQWYPKALGNYDYREGVKWVKELIAASS